FPSRRLHTIFSRDWSSDVCSSDLRASEGWAPPSRTSRTQEFYHPRMPSLVPFRRLEPDCQKLSRLWARLDWPEELLLRFRLFRRSEERRVGKASRSREARGPGEGR